MSRGDSPALLASSVEALAEASASASGRFLFGFRFLFCGLGLFLLFFRARGLSDGGGNAGSARFFDVCLQLGGGAFDLDLLEHLAVGAVQHLELEAALADLAGDDGVDAQPLGTFGDGAGFA
jgi:hypothetical protein